MLLKGRNAVITGCAKGIGKSILEVFARNGANIWACVRKPSKEFTEYIEALSNACRVNITPIYFDLGNEEQIKAGIKNIIGSKQQIDILVNNAGMVSKNALFQMTSIDTIKNVFEINFFAQILITQYISRAMIKQKSGSIINISSISGIDGNPGQLEYVASKAALIGATKKLASEFASLNIRVNTIAPGVIGTSMVKNMTDETMNNIINQIMMKRIGQPIEIAQAALFLASDMSSYITGQVLRVDGGM